jgi:AcrR family transcriptional regulator
VGLRETKKERTRREIADAAMRLFVLRGFARVTVAEVAVEAGVSEKTVFNYFPTKEDLFFDEVDEREAALVAAIRDRRPSESIPAALRRHQNVDCARMCTESFAAFARLIEESPALRAKELEVMARFTRTLANALEREAGCTEVEARVARRASARSPAGSARRRPGGCVPISPAPTSYSRQGSETSASSPPR